MIITNNNNVRCGQQEEYLKSVKRENLYRRPMVGVGAMIQQVVSLRYTYNHCGRNGGIILQSFNR